MNISDIEAFVALAETGSVNRAALRLNLTQPAVTRRIQSFEAAMGGVPLLDRRTKPPILTPEGRRVLEGCRHVVRAVAELKLDAGGGPPAGEIRIGVAHGLAEMVLTAPIDAMRRRFSGVRPRVTSHWTTWLVKQVRNGALDCAIGLVTPDHSMASGVYSTAIGVEQVVVVASPEVIPPSTKANLGGHVGLRDLAGSEWILNPAGCGYRDAIQRRFDLANLPLRIAAEVFGHDLQISLVARGAGLGLVPRRQIENSPYRRQLRILRLTDFDLPVTITLLHGGFLGRFSHVIEHFQTQIGNALQHDAGHT